MEFLTRYWYLAIIGLCITIIGLQHFDIEKIKLERDASKAELLIVSSKLTEQNNAILLWEKAAELQNEKIRQAEAESKLQEQNYFKQVDVIKKASIPSACVDAVSWGRKELIKIAQN